MTRIDPVGSQGSHLNLSSIETGTIGISIQFGIFTSLLDSKEDVSSADNDGGLQC